MKIITHYQCEICKRQYDNPKDAQECEARGYPTPLPIGLIFNNPAKEEFYSNMTFAIAKVCKDIYDPHSLDYSLWATRDSHVGDSLDDDLCGGNSDHPVEGRDIPDLSHPTFQRMVAYLKAHKVPVTVWNGERPVPLKEFLRARQ